MPERLSGRKEAVEVTWLLFPCQGLCVLENSDELCFFAFVRLEPGIKKIPGDVAKSALLPSGMDQIDTNNKYTNTITTRDGWIDGPRTVSVAENED